jgi:hypothetical protein
MNNFAETLKGVDKVLYKSAYEFELKFVKGATEESAHQAGLEKLEQIKKLKAEASKPQVYMNLKTGEKFISTENDLEGMFS